MIDNKDKIGHPFQAPEHFFEEMSADLKESLNALPQEQSAPKRTKTILIGTLKYAAIIAFAFFIGRYSNSQVDDKIDEHHIYNQVSEDDIIDFVLEENIDIELLNRLL